MICKTEFSQPCAQAAVRWDKNRKVVYSPGMELACNERKSGTERCEILTELHSGFCCDTSQPGTVMREAENKWDVLSKGQAPSSLLRLWPNLFSAARAALSAPPFAPQHTFGMEQKKTCFQWAVPLAEQKASPGRQQGAHCPLRATQRTCFHILCWVGKTLRWAERPSAPYS